MERKFSWIENALIHNVKYSSSKNMRVDYFARKSIPLFQIITTRNEFWEKCDIKLSWWTLLWRFINPLKNCSPPYQYSLSIYQLFAFMVQTLAESRRKSVLCAFILNIIWPESWFFQFLTKIWSSNSKIWCVAQIYFHYIKIRSFCHKNEQYRV